MDATGIQVRWRNPDNAKNWGEVHIYQKQGQWCLDAQGESDAVVEVVFQSWRHYLRRTG